MSNTPMVELPVEVFNAMTNALRNDIIAKEAALMQARALMAAVEKTAKLKEDAPLVSAPAPEVPYDNNADLSAGTTADFQGAIEPTIDPGRTPV